MKNSMKLTIFLIPIGIAVNVVIGQIVLLLKLPIYLDAIGTILVGALCGVWPGALVGLATNALLMITSPTVIYYAILNVLFGVVAGLFSKAGIFKSLWKTVICSLAFAVIGGGIGSVITNVAFGGLGGGTTSAIAAVLSGTVGIPLWLAVFISEFIFDIVDKVPTAIIVFLIIKGMPNRFLVKLPLGHIYTPEEVEDDDDLADDIV